MYQAKKLGKACHQLFSEDMYEAALKKITLEQDMRLALLHFQQSQKRLVQSHRESVAHNHPAEGEELQGQVCLIGCPKN